MDRISKALELARKGQRAPPSFPRVEHPRQVSYTQTRTVQVSPEFLRAHRVVSGFYDEPLADAYRLLRTRVLHRMQQNNWKTIGVTSAAPGDGKTLTAINLGISVAMEPNYAVLLVDADLRRPAVHSFFGIEPENGLGEYLEAEITVQDVLIHPGIERFVILPCRKAFRNSSELLTTPRMVQLVQELKARYPSRLVIFDLPPVLVGDDVVAFSSLLDAVLLVVDNGKTRPDELSRAVELLENVNLVGTVLNRSTEIGHGHDYTYY